MWEKKGCWGFCRPGRAVSSRDRLARTFGAIFSRRHLCRRDRGSGPGVGGRALGSQSTGGGRTARDTTRQRRRRRARSAWASLWRLSKAGKKQAGRTKHLPRYLPKCPGLPSERWRPLSLSEGLVRMGTAATATTATARVTARTATPAPPRRPSSRPPDHPSSHAPDYPSSRPPVHPSSHARRLRPLPLRERRQLSVDAPSSVDGVAIEFAAQIAPQIAPQIADEIAAEIAAEIGDELGRSNTSIPSEQSAASEGSQSRQSRESRAAGEARATCGAQRWSHPP